jgi:hypothetical protein
LGGAQSINEACTIAQKIQSIIVTTLKTNYRAGKKFKNDINKRHVCSFIFH